MDNLSIYGPIFLIFIYYQLTLTGRCKFGCKLLYIRLPYNDQEETQ